MVLVEPPMLGHLVVVEGVFVDGVVDGVAVLAVRMELLDAGVDEAACAITKLPTPVPASKPTESSAVAAILRSPVFRFSGSSGGGGGGMNWSPSMVLYLLGDWRLTSTSVAPGRENAVGFTWEIAQSCEPTCMATLVFELGLAIRSHGVVRPEGLEPPHPAPEAGALSN